MRGWGVARYLLIKRTLKLFVRDFEFLMLKTKLLMSCKEVVMIINKIFIFSAKLLIRFIIFLVPSLAMKHMGGEGNGLSHLMVILVTSSSSEESSSSSSCSSSSSSSSSEIHSPT